MTDALIHGTPMRPWRRRTPDVPFSITVTSARARRDHADEYAGRTSITHTYPRLAGHSDVTVSGTPSSRASTPTPTQLAWSCRSDGTTDRRLPGEIGDWQQWPDPAQWNDFNGLHQWTNVELTEIPPQITGTRSPSPRSLATPTS